jgi:putative exporter of polyketide antibiotics
MNSSEKPRGMATISSEALIGIGITVAWLGIMCLLLGWAEYMRSVPKTAWIWLALGVVLVVLGGLAALSAKSRDRRPIRAERAFPSDAPPQEPQSEPEEQRF